MRPLARDAEPVKRAGLFLYTKTPPGGRAVSRVPHDVGCGEARALGRGLDEARQVAQGVRGVGGGVVAGARVELVAREARARGWRE